MSSVGTAIAARQRQAYSLLARGFSVDKIAKTMGLTVPTIKKYIEQRKEELSAVIGKIEVEDYAGMVLSSYGQIREEIWSNYENSAKSADKARFLKLLLDTEKHQRESLQELGVLNRQAKETKHTFDASVEINRVDRSKLDALTSMIVAQRLGTTPEKLMATDQRRNETISRSLSASTLVSPEEEGEIVSPVKEPINID